MTILQVAPLIRLPSTLTSSLTYYHTSALPRGSVVWISVRNQTYLGVVTAASSLQEAKIYLRKAESFSLKSITDVFSSAPLISEPQLQLAEWMSQYYAYSLGMLLKSFLPRIHNTLKNIPKDITPLESPVSSERFQLGSLLLPDTRRIHQLMDFIHQRFTDKGQILILVPSLYALNVFAEAVMAAYPSERISVLTSGMSTRNFRTEWEHIHRGTRSVILSTRAGLFLPFRNLHTIVLEQETSAAYYSFDMYPRYHTTDVAYQLARLHGSFLLFADTLPSLKSLAYFEHHQLSPPDFPALPTETIYGINMANERHDSTSPFLTRFLRDELSVSSPTAPVLILSNRRGNSPFIICKQCGFRFTCPHCESLLVEHTVHIDRHTVQNIFTCHKCTRKFQPKTECPQCASSEIRYAGAGTQKLADSIHQEFPHLSVSILDTDYTPQYTEQVDLFRRWQTGEIDVLVATQMIDKFFALPLQSSPITVIRESDLMFRFPQFHAKEESLILFSRLIGQSQRTYLQFWDQSIPEERESSPLDHMQASHLSTLYADEQTERAQFGYPPYMELIAIHSIHRHKSRAWDQARRTKRTLKDISLTPLGPIEKVQSGGRFQVTLLLRIRPEESLPLKRRLLGILERGQQIDINPKDVL